MILIYLTYKSIYKRMRETLKEGRKKSFSSVIIPLARKRRRSPPATCNQDRRCLVPSVQPCVKSTSIADHSRRRTQHTHDDDVRSRKEDLHRTTSRIQIHIRYTLF